MNAYRVTGKVGPDRTITVQVPDASIGAEAEVIVLFPHETKQKDTPHPLTSFLEDLRNRPASVEGAQRSAEEQAFVRELRKEWD